MEALGGKYQYEAQDTHAPKNEVNLPAKRKRKRLPPKEAKVTRTQAMIDLRLGVGNAMLLYATQVHRWHA